MLTQQTSSPECWQSDDFRAGAAGLYAFIVGVSSYPWLNNGAHWSGDDPLKLNMGQLYTSAHSAYQFFCWLRERYAFRESPLVKAWLYLAPTENERARINVPATVPTLDAFTDGLNDWHDALVSAADGPAPENCRALFFFSGHGIEVDQDRQILLPSDFGRRPNRPDESVSTAHIHSAISSAGVPWSLFLIDSCRSDNELLRLFQSIQGRTVLPSPRRDRKPSGSAPIIYAAASGMKAYQYNTLDRANGLTLFTSALIEAVSLDGPNPIKPDCSAPPCVVRVPELYQWLNSRMGALYASELIAEPDPVVQGGHLRGTMPFLHVDPIAATAAETKPEHAEVDFYAKLSIVQPDLPLLDQGSFGNLGKLQRARYADEDADRLTTALGSWPVRQFVFEMRFYEYRDDDWLPRDADYDIARIERTEKGDFARVTFAVDVERWRYIEARSHPWTYGFLVPSLPRSTLLEMEIVYEEPAVRRASFFLSRRNKDYRGALGAIWKIGRTQGAPAALAAYRNAFRQRGRARMQPLVVLIGALLEIGCGERTSARESITRLLATNYSSDAVVLLMQLDMDEEGALAVSRTRLDKYLATLARYGIPATAVATGHLLAQLKEMRHSDAFGAALAATNDRRGILSSLLSRLDGLSTNYRGNGFFSSFATDSYAGPLGVAPVAA
jgi:caspase domain-containing protein